MNKVERVNLKRHGNDHVGFDISYKTTNQPIVLWTVIDFTVARGVCPPWSINLFQL